MVEDMDKVLNCLSEIEETAEDILTDREQIVNIDRRRNEMREGIRVIINESKEGKEKKQWICMGNMFVKMENTTAKQILEKDHKTLDSEIDKIRKGLKQKVGKLRELEGQPELRGFDLNPLLNQEVLAVSGIRT